MQRPTRAEGIRGLKYLRAFMDVLEPLREQPVHGNRSFFMDEYVGLVLLSFFNPTLTSLRSLQQATGLGNVQKAVGVKRTSLGAMSESASKVFDPELMRPILQQVADQVQGLPRDPKLQDLPETIKAVDGSFLRCLPKMVWAVFRKNSEHRAAKMHVHFDIRRGIADEIDVTDALASEKKTLRKRLQGAALYILDRGYIDYRLFQQVHEAGSTFVARIKDNSACETIEPRPLSDADREAGVLADAWVRVGSAATKGQLTAPVRRVVIEKPGGHDLILLTNLGEEVDAETIGVIYRQRWQVELFFRWFKCILGCTHWLSQSRDGLTLQVYIALLASLLISLWTGRKPTKRTFEMIQLYFQGWATEQELSRHIERLKTKD